MRLVLLALLFAPGLASAATYTVCPVSYGTCDFLTITIANADARVVDGTTLELYGNIVEAVGVSITKDLTLIGKGATRPTIAATTGNTTITFESGSVSSLSAVEVIPGVHRAVEVKTKAIVTVDDLLVESATTAGNGVGMQINDGTVTVTDSTFQSLATSGNAGAINLSNGATVAVFDNVSFTGNTAIDGGAIRADGVSLTLTDCTFTSNAAKDDGGAVYLKGSGSYTSTGTTFSTNTAVDDGGAVYQESAPATWTAALFDGNLATGDAGAVFAQSGDTTFDACDFDGNAAGYATSTVAYGGDIRATASDIVLLDATSTGGAADYGGSLAIDASSTGTVTGSDFAASSAVNDGGHIHALGVVTLTDSTFTGGVAGYRGGSVAAFDTDLAIDTCTFSSNSSTATSSSTYGGGAVYAETTDTTVVTSDFVGNTSGRNGGGIYVYEQGTLAVTDSTFTSNASSAGGGGINFWSDGTLDIAGSTFTTNSGTYGGAVVDWEWSSSAGLDLTTSTFVGNTSTTSDGGAVYVNIGDALTITDSTFEANTAADTGGAVHVNDQTGGAVLWYRNWFCDNKASNDGGAAWLYDLSTSFTHQIASNVFVENEAVDDGGSLYVTSATTLDVLNNDFLTGKGATASGGGVYSSQIDFVNNLVAYVPAGDGYAVTSSSGSVTYNGWYSNTTSNISGSITTLGATNVTASDPLLLDYTAGDGCSAADLRYLSTSPMIDKGSTTLTDKDGTRSDIGAYGGAYADPDAWVDADGDGTRWVYDCDDTDATIEPGATETCDGVDEDCDGVVDDGAASGTSYLDADGDGYGTSATTSTACPAPSGYVATSTDCDDGASAVNPAAAETCNGVDDDCDGTIDDGVKTTYYADSDGDGFGDAGASTTACSAPSGYVADSTDCNDGSATVKPGASEACNGIDDNCDATIDEGVKTTYYADSDSDGYGSATSTTAACSAPSGYVADATDCNDSSATIKPGGTETCNGVDDDCDATVDEGVKTTYYADSDSDGYGSSTVTTSACSAPTGYVSDATDCNDASATIKPGGTETCNGVDDDCDTTVDEGVKTTYYADSDGDGYGAAAVTSAACSAPSGYVADKTDCNDASAAVKPGATESCDGVDEDCDGAVDDGAIDTTAWYADGDDDGYGAGAATYACDAPSGAVADDSDCDDAAATTFPGGTEFCNGVDDDCDGTIDDDVATYTFYRDADGDGFGDATDSVVDCEPPSGYGLDGSDCDDSDDTVGAPGPWYADADGDGFGDASAIAYACDAPTGYVADGDDCDDSDDAVGDGFDWYADADGDGLGDAASTVYACDAPSGYLADASDCDDADETVAGPATWHRDADVDGYGDAAATTDACDAPSGYVADATDCDDTETNTHPGAVDQCNNSIDDDCDGAVDEEDVYVDWYYDGDSDFFGDDATVYADCAAPTGYIGVGGDCDDANGDVFPTAIEVCNGIDDDCDGDIDGDAVDGTAWHPDGDGDGYGTSDEVFACDAPSGHVADGGDCDDTDGSAFPGAAEVCDGADDDCDGEIDEGAGSTWYADADGDGFGDDSTAVTACDPPAGAVDVGGDCDDADAGAYPGAEEIAGDGIDQDCDGADLDEEVPGEGTRAWAGGDTGGEEPVPGAGCSCDSGANPAGWLGLLGLLAAVGARRRRREP